MVVCKVTMGEAELRRIIKDMLSQKRWARRRLISRLCVGILLVWVWATSFGRFLYRTYEASKILPREIVWRGSLSKIIFYALSFIILLFLLLSARKMQERVILRQMRKPSYQQMIQRTAERKYTFDENGVSVITNEESGQSSWSAFSSWVEDEEYLLLRKGEGRIPIRKSTLDPRELDELRGYLQTYIGQ